MIATNLSQTTAITTSRPMQPHWAEIVEIVQEAPAIGTYWLCFLNEALRKNYSFLPGQFNMLSMPGIGESAISISSSHHDKERIGHTVRLAGNTTNAIARLQVGDTLGVRGPFGTSWPIEECRGQDIYIAAGGIGLPPLRSFLYHVLKNRDDFGRVVVIYGARTPPDLQFVSEYEAWKAGGVEMIVTVDRGDENWTGPVGVVPIMFYQLRMEPRRSVVLTCGPEIMIRFVIFEALARRIPASRIFVSMERNMKCGLGFCGHCQIGPFFVCKDGPIFTYQQLQPYFNVEDL